MKEDETISWEKIGKRIKRAEQTKENLDWQSMQRVYYDNNAKMKREERKYIGRLRIEILGKKNKIYRTKKVMITFSRE